MNLFSTVSKICFFLWGLLKGPIFGSTYFVILDVKLGFVVNMKLLVLLRYCTVLYCKLLLMGGGNGISLMQVQRRMGRNANPCGTSDRVGFGMESKGPNLTRKVRFSR